jgi:uncharacterized RDD family membrane protein YckC
MEQTILDNNFSNPDYERPPVWAGFWIRVGASLVDFLVMLPLVGLTIYNLIVLKSYPIAIFVLVVPMLYKPLMEAKYSTTLGKMAVKIKLVNTSNQNISIKQAIIRYLPWLIGYVFSFYTTYLLFQHSDFNSINTYMDVSILQAQVAPKALNYVSSFILFISCVFVAFTQNKQGLHDLLANTFCVYK